MSAEIEELIRSHLHVVQEILELTHQPALSMGVISQGKEVFRHNQGIIDHETGQKSNSNICTALHLSRRRSFLPL